MNQHDRVGAIEVQFRIDRNDIAQTMGELALRLPMLGPHAIDISIRLCEPRDSFYTENCEIVVTSGRNTAKVLREWMGRTGVGISGFVSRVIDIASMEPAGK
jgi:hypothetical protein